MDSIGEMLVDKQQTRSKCEENAQSSCPGRRYTMHPMDLAAPLGIVETSPPPEYTDHKKLNEKGEEKDGKEVKENAIQHVSLLTG